MTEFRAWLSIQLMGWAINVCPFEEMQDLLRASIMIATNQYLGDLDESE